MTLPPPAEVMAAIERMSRPAWGVPDSTIARDRADMAMIRAYVTGEPIKTPRELAVERVTRLIAIIEKHGGTVVLGSDVTLEDLRELVAAAGETVE